jgi:hypothetical protein
MGMADGAAFAYVAYEPTSLDVIAGVPKSVRGEACPATMIEAMDLRGRKKWRVKEIILCES